MSQAETGDRNDESYHRGQHQCVGYPEGRLMLVIDGGQRGTDPAAANGLELERCTLHGT